MHTTPSTVAAVVTTHQLHFKPLTCKSPDLCFPCDCEGHVDLNHMSERERNVYFFARITVGHEVAKPVVEQVAAATH